jgi:hypothetical protein
LDDLDQKEKTKKQNGEDSPTLLSVDLVWGSYVSRPLLCREDGAGYVLCVLMGV